VNASDDSERQPLENGQRGLVLARGPQVMKGYYNNEKATRKSIDHWGWFDTGDLGYINPATGDLVLIGRAKETIVLSNGENIEPNPIEDALLGCKLIDQVVLKGQDQKQLTGIVVLNPRELANAGYIDDKEGERLQQLADKINEPLCPLQDYLATADELNKSVMALRQNKQLHAHLKEESKRLLQNFRKWEQIGNFDVLLEPVSSDALFSKNIRH
jgi:long-chain acyl-CoA synthetase